MTVVLPGRTGSLYSPGTKNLILMPMLTFGIDWLHIPDFECDYSWSLHRHVGSCCFVIAAVNSIECLSGMPRFVNGTEYISAAWFSLSVYKLR